MRIFISSLIRALATEGAAAKQSPFSPWNSIAPPALPASRSAPVFGRGLDPRKLIWRDAAKRTFRDHEAYREARVPRPVFAFETDGEAIAHVTAAMILKCGQPIAPTIRMFITLHPDDKAQRRAGNSRVYRDGRFRRGHVSLD
jgi:hypothetical protein